ncbi:transketolase [Candidatus Nomurabacteria bacterium RIFCSPLOWO2_01_FULL_42_20]|uniref:Transketolase n=1 Tax=Candidatus Nomurabacteria bacterium RIFCSPHIGHO2_01_FULL_42_16 TaxID=1801743 RepID=A0A1F6VHY0_9BACT|nr:MAG: transketolase [Candidatus Nomurabacteria bacterium RIFCSPHIGHO2_01_FULL_42_16]OGI92106.1 MAG: transketolase [Candidatus Nomurabacteria bacterium RIFCSPLOWO2_01_FULL_42_20]
MLTDKKNKELELTANRVRQTIIEMLIPAGAGHTAGPLGMADIFTALYFHVLKHDPKNPAWPERDRLILSNGHICPVRYSAMYHAGYDITPEELKTFRKIGSRLEGHPNMRRLPALETSSGPLGEGLSQACGFALAARMDGNQNKYHIWCLTSDGEHEEGMTWEAVMLAAKYKLDNLTVIIDRNYIQIDGDTESVMPLDPLAEKYKSFNWNVLETDGHDFNEIVARLEESKADRGRPTVIIARTTPGKGVSFMENDYRWHGIPPGLGPEDKVPRERQAAEALRELKEIENNLLK